MNEKLFLEINGIVFKKSSHSVSGGGKCVGVSIQDDYIQVINTKKKDKVVEFTKDEWKAFISGVKEGEFDIH
jgi:hypothetical protein